MNEVLPPYASKFQSGSSIPRARSGDSGEKKPIQSDSGMFVAHTGKLRTIEVNTSTSELKIATSQIDEVA